MIKDISTKNVIKTAALKLFKEKGYDKTSIVDICTACGISKTAFYYHFKSKDELLNFYYQTHYDYQSTLLEAITINNSIKGLWHVLSAYLENMTNNGFEISKQVIKSNLDENKGTFSNKGRYTKEICVNLIRDAQISGKIQNPTKPEKIYSAIMNAMVGILVLWSIENGSFDMKDSFKEKFEAILGLEEGLLD